MQKAKSLTEAKTTFSGVHACLLGMSCYKGQQYETWKVKNHHSPEQDGCMRHLKVENKLFLEKKERLEG